MTPIRTVSTKTAVIDTKSGTTEMTEDDEVTGTLDPLALDCREDDFHNIKISSDDVVQCLYGKKCNVIFLLTNIEAGKHVRESLSMKEKVDGRHILIPMVQPKRDIRRINSNEESTDSRAVTPSNSRAVTPADDGEERSPSPPRILFSGTVEKLITYPPPPATGGITVTNEDLFCLTDGEFLNDVIIDFYLKYLVHEKLSESDHFIIVPINERSHWFLAIICFPGYSEVKTVRYLCRETTAEETPEPKGENSQTDTDESQQPSVGENNNKENQNTEEEESSEKSNNVKCKQESPMEEDEEQDTEEPMDTNETNVDTAETGSNSGVDSQEPRGRLLTEEELKDPEMIKNSKEGIQQPCIMVMDSLAGQSRQRIINSLKDYLQVEWNCKKSQTGSIREKFKGASPKVPQQTNYSDCGVYVLQYVDSFFEDPIFNFSFPMKSLANWFTEERVTRKREKISKNW
ncbi:SENP6 [Mytilus edulis]|uniref:SENP6 n=1 Tax=Mytilus edulis TaxID=6550 RepID=A0A8S3TAV7_MYTED|nr:SENP6 [Mytilus edulis]